MSKRTIKAIVPTAVILFTLSIVYGWQTGWFAPAPPEKITIGTAVIGMNGLLFVAKSQGFDRLHGLDLTIKEFGAGRDAVREIRAGRLEFACCTEFVLVNEIFSGADNLRCLSTVSSGVMHALIARRDKGIARPEDLRGKIIGIAMGTAAEFFLARFLTFNMMPLHEVTVVDINPPEQAAALAGGKVDAVLSWEPLTKAILSEVGANALIWPAQEGQDSYWLLVSQEEVIKKRQPEVEKLLAALNQAADFIRQQPATARAIMAHWMKEPVADLQAGKYPMRYELILDQGLLLAMEDQARWMMGNKLTYQTKVPNYLDYIDAEALLKVDSKAVRLVLPGPAKVH
jgi:NitT/TauT family transport system substrate-binding protein